MPEGIKLFDQNGQAVAGKALVHAIEINDFKINSDKTRLQSNKIQQSVTGIIVNRKSNLNRRYIRQIRAMIHAWDKYGYVLAQKEYIEEYLKKNKSRDELPPDYFRRVIIGKLEYLRAVKKDKNEDPVYKNLQKQLAKVDKITMDYMIKENEKKQQRDAFICHASKDKDSIARPLSRELIRQGYSVWFDEYELKVGDSLREKIDEGLLKSRYGIVILSKNFFARRWPKRELDALTVKEDNGDKVILPIWHQITGEEVASKSLLLAGIYAIESENSSIEEITAELIKVLKEN